MCLPVFLLDQIIWLIKFLSLLILVQCLCLHARIKLGVFKTCMVSDAIRANRRDVVVFFINESFGLRCVILLGKWILIVVYISSLNTLLLKVVLKSWVLRHLWN